MKISIFHFIK